MVTKKLFGVEHSFPTTFKTPALLHSAVSADLSFLWTFKVFKFFTLLTIEEFKNIDYSELIEIFKRQCLLVAAWNIFWLGFVNMNISYNQTYLKLSE